MMFKLEIETSGAAFRNEDVINHDGEPDLDPSSRELRVLLGKVEVQLAHGMTDGVLMDSNGNRVGKWRLE
jgi:hypothetical protein